MLISKISIIPIATLVFLSVQWSLSGQEIERFAISSARGSLFSGDTVLDWTLGEGVVSTFEQPAISLTQGFHQPAEGPIRLAIVAILEGPYDKNVGLMRDDLLASSLIPSSEPFTALGFLHFPPGGGEILSSSLLDTLGPNAIVDWILVELRSVGDSQVVATRSCLLQRDGDVIQADGSSPVDFDDMPFGDYLVSLRHRNHLGVMATQSVSPGSEVTIIDFSDPLTAVYGSEARKSIKTIEAMWAGNTVPDDLLKYAGLLNDRDPILVRIGGIVPTNVVTGYYSEDVNLNTETKYGGLFNDRDIILLNIGGSIATAVRAEQLP